MAKNHDNIITYCANNLSLTIGEVLAIANTGPRRYYVWQVAKRSGGKRTLCHPARELKPIQHFFLRCILYDLPIHPAATAYVNGSSIKKNALAHRCSRVILKLDFEEFFDSLRVENWLKYAAHHFIKWTPEELDFSCRILFWGGRSNTPERLAIGAPTSPLLSNALMYDVDVKLQTYAEQTSLVYTRYADDITFSSNGAIDRDGTISAVREALAQAAYTSVRLNYEKTILASSKVARRITGLVVTPDHKISLGRHRKRTLSAMVHHARDRKLTPEAYSKLAGLLAFASDVEPTFIETLRRKYSSELIDRIMRHEFDIMPMRT